MVTPKTHGGADHPTAVRVTRPLLNDHDIETLLESLRLFAGKSIYSASEACRLARALVHPSKGRRMRWVEPRFTFSQFLGEIDDLIRVHRVEMKSHETKEQSTAPQDGPNVAAAPR